MTDDRDITDMVPVRSDQLPAHAGVGETAAAHLEAMEWRQKIIEQRLPAILKRTSPRHWIDYGGESDPRPEDEAAVIFATMLGVSYRWIPQPGGGKYRREPIAGKAGHYEIIVEIEGSAFGRTVEDTGAARSDDPLLASGKRAVDGTALFSDVLKKSQANGIVRLLQALGMRGLTWEDLAKAGISRDACHRVEFAEGEGARAKREQRSQVSKPCPTCASTPCDKCQETGKGGMLTLRAGKRGNFLGCSHYPACTHTEEPPAEQPEEPEAPAPADDGADAAAAQGEGDVRTAMNEQIEKLLVSVFPERRSERTKFLHDTYQVNTVAALDDAKAADCLAALRDIATPAAGAGGER